MNKIKYEKRMKELDQMYVWCVTVFGTPWEDVLTNILLKNPEQAA